jgi:predicted MFS family arabinose efflux permease
VASATVGLYLLPFAAGNFAGPLVLGRFFDTLGRKVMISGTYILSGALLAVTAWLFDQGTLNATTQTAAWVIIFFFASAGASSAYLTVSEIFPMETRAIAIAFFYAIGTAVGGHLRAAAVRRPHRVGEARRPGRRLPHRRGADDRRRAGRGVAGRERRAETAGGDRDPADRRGR